MFASGSGFVYHILVAYKQAIENMNINYQQFGKKLDIKDLTIGLFEGSIDLAKREPETSLEVFRKRVMSKKGTTE